MKKVVVLVIVLCTILSVTAVNVEADKFCGQDSKFTDVSGHWAEYWITLSESRNFISGYPDGTFRPDNEISVAEYIKIITMQFYDLYQYKEPQDGEHWAMQYVKLMQRKHTIPYGKYETKEELDRKITRNEMATISLVVLLKLNPRNDEIAIDDDAEYKQYFSDINELSADEKRYINTLAKYEKIVGYPDGTFRPYDGLTRAEALKIALSLSL